MLSLHLGQIFFARKNVFCIAKKELGAFEDIETGKDAPDNCNITLKTRPSVMEVSPWTFGLSKPILPIDHQIAGDH